MKKKIMSVVMSIVMLFGVVSFAGCQDNTAGLQAQIDELQEKLDEKTETIEELEDQIFLLSSKKEATECLELYATNKGKENYTTATWEQINAIIKAGEKEIDKATNISEIDAILESKEMAIDEILTQKEEMAGKCYSLEEAYENGLLTIEDIKHISYFRKGAVYMIGADLIWEKIDFIPSMEKPVLTEEIENYLIDTFYKNYLEYPESETPKEDLEVTHYFGKYGNCYVASLEGNWGSGTGGYEICVGGIVWSEMGCTFIVFVCE